MAKKSNTDGLGSLQLKPGFKIPTNAKQFKAFVRNKLLPDDTDLDISESSRYVEVGIGDYVLEEGKLHAKNINVGRSIPRIEDGLKSVERRALHTMHLMKLNNSAKRVKVSSVVGQMIKWFYPHGEQAAADAIFRVGRKTAAMIPYIDGQGSYGDIVTLRAASQRYAEARLSKYAVDCFFSETDVPSPLYSTTLSYNKDLDEPEYLVTKYPNILMQWNKGIGKGAFSYIAAFNSTDIFNATLKLMDDPDAKIEIYPDTPVPLDIVNKKELKKCFDLYTHTIKVRGQYRVETQIGKDEHGRKFEKNVIIFTSCPMSTCGKAIEDAIVAIKSPDKSKSPRKDTLNEIIDVHTATAINPKTGKRDQDMLELTIEYEQGYDPHVIAEKLFKMTPLAETIPVKYNMIFNNKPVKYTPRKILLEWISLRLDQKRSYFQQKVGKAMQERDTCEALLIIHRLNKIDEMIKIIKKSKTDEETIKNLVSKYPITTQQATVLSGKSLRSLNVENINKLQERYEQACKDYEYYRGMCNERSIREAIKNDLREGLEKYSRPRMAKLMNLSKTSGDSDDKKVIVYNSENYYCLSSYNDITKIANKIDKSYDIVKITNGDRIIVFGKNGIMKNLDGFAFTTNDSGISFERMGFSNVASIIKVKDKNSIYAFITKHGYGKRMPISECLNSNKTKCISLNNDDELVSVVHINDTGLIHMINGNKVYYLNSETLPLLKRGAGGNRLIKSNDICISSAIYTPDAADYVLIYGEAGYGKIIDTRMLSTAQKTTRKANNHIVMNNKDVYHVHALNSKCEFTLYDIKGKHNMKFNIDKKISLIEGDKTITRFASSTSIAAPTKIFSKSKSEFYRIR